MDRTKRLLGLFLIVFMLLAFVPLQALATSNDVDPVDAEAQASVINETGVVAKVGNTEYATIDEAIANWTNGTTLTLLADVTLSDVIKLSSTEYHILDLGTYTMTAAKNKDAIQYVVNGRSSASYALDIKADATNPGGITATGKSVVSHTKPLSGAPSKDRPITRFYGGVFNASYVVKQGGSFGAGYTGASAPYFYFYGGTFNGTISTNRSMMQFHGGTFNGSLFMSVDSSAYALVAGGRFKYLSNTMNSELNADKFVIGSAKGTYDRSIYVDKEGYYVITNASITEVSEKYPAVVRKTYNATSDFFYYSSAATYGLFYEDAQMAIDAYGEENVTVYVKPAVTIPDSVTGDAAVVEEIKNNTALEDYTPENLPEGAELEIELKSVGETIVYDVTPMANGTEVEPTEAITFRLPIPASVTKAYAKVYHDGTLMGIYEIKGEGDAKYVEISSADFSEFAVEPTVVVAQIGEEKYETLLAALAAANDNDVVVINEGEYNLGNTTYTIDKAITIQGAGKDKTTLNFEFGSAASAFTIASSNVTIKDLTIAQSKVVSDTFFVSVARGAYGSYDVKYSDITLSNVEFNGGKYALCITANNIVIDSCDFTNQDSSNIIVYAVQGDSKIINNTFTTVNGGKYAIMVEGGTSGAAATMMSTGTLTIDGNTSEGVKLFFIFNNYGRAEDLTLNITNNDISNCSNKPIAFMPGDGSEEFYEINVNRNKFIETLDGRPVINDERNGANEVVIDMSGNYWGSEAPDFSALAIGSFVEVYPYYADEALTILVRKAVATVNGVEYSTLEEALTALEAGSTLTLLSNVTISEKLTLPAGIILNGNGKSITGEEVWAAGDLTFVGHTKLTNFNAGYNKPTITIGAGACLEFVGTGRMVIGHGATFNITGTITDAKTANVAELTPSLIIPGASFTGAGVNFNVTNAYIKVCRPSLLFRDSRVPLCSACSRGIFPRL